MIIFVVQTVDAIYVSKNNNEVISIHSASQLWLWRKSLRSLWSFCYRSNFYRIERRSMGIRERERERQRALSYSPSPLTLDIIDSRFRFFMPFFFRMGKSCQKWIKLVLLDVLPAQHEEIIKNGPTTTIEKMQRRANSFVKYTYM